MTAAARRSGGRPLSLKRSGPFSLVSSLLVNDFSSFLYPERVADWKEATGQKGWAFFRDNEGGQKSNLATVGDWSEAQPLHCGFPASPPSVGDYLEIEDTLPALEVGQGSYYVTAVTNDGERRYGRKRNGGLLSGRDPALLPGCSE